MRGFGQGLRAQSSAHINHAYVRRFGHRSVVTHNAGPLTGDHAASSMRSEKSRAVNYRQHFR